jgi:hypothetical protein
VFNEELFTELLEGFHGPTSEAEGDEEMERTVQAML